MLVVELQALDDPEAVPQGRGEEPGPGGGPDQGERGKVELDGAGRRALPDQDVELEVLHRRVEDLLDHRAQAVDLVDEEHVPGLEAGEQRGHVARALQHRARGLAQPDAHLPGDDVGEGGLAEARRTEHQQVVQGLAPPACGLDEDGELLPDRRLTHEVLQAQGPHGAVQHLVLAGGRGPQEPSAGGRHGHGAGPTSRPPGGGTVTAQAPVRSRWAGPGWTAARRG